MVLQPNRLCLVDSVDVVLEKQCNFALQCLIAQDPFPHKCALS